MRLAWVTPSPPYPPNEGARVVAFNRISRLYDRGHEIHVLAPVDKRMAERERRMEAYCTTATYFPRDGALAEQLRRPWTPHLTARTRSEALQTRLDELVKEGIDAIFVEYTPMAEYADDRSVPTCIGVHNVEYRLLAGMARSLIPSPVAAAYAIEAARLFRYERAAYRERWADAYVFLSSDERREVTDRYPNVAECAFESPVGVDIGRFRSVERPEFYPTDQPVIVYTGSMSYKPNIDAVRWFVHDIFPRVRERHPEATFFVVGKDPDPTVCELSDRPGVTVTGRVEHIEPYIAGADVAVVPLRQGGGMKIKLLEALAAAQPVVTTSVGIRGTAFEGGEHVFLADIPAVFAERVADVLNDANRGDVRITGHRFACDTYSWKAVIDQLETVLRTVVNQR
ncbi:glycosyltransferase family 4 protein [Haladaptatus salinisoli]|uniref:glycosyltransferase family 4 protein n=1 Tax=Haladaptatus salinisoli TaxID=2884876 RepID=UPI001D0A19F6|nr:glycosyltransferase family 4 protein [Haladaptatus salinisoli]